jgi:hypothetical protein
MSSQSRFNKNVTFCVVYKKRKSGAKIGLASDIFFMFSHRPENINIFSNTCHAHIEYRDVLVNFFRFFYILECFLFDRCRKKQNNDHKMNEICFALAVIDVFRNATICVNCTFM